MKDLARITCALAFSLAAVACGPSVSGDDDDDVVTDDPCTGSETRCIGQSFQVCNGEVFVSEEMCSAACDPGLGCVDCRPDFGRTCQGDSVHECNDDGTVGELVETCELEMCNNGGCGGSDDCAEGADVIYVVDESYNLLSFDPRKLDTEPDPADAFELIGSLSCPAGTPWPEWAGGSTPFSMSVDRDATAWVLYTSGEIFHVSTRDASCQPTSFTPGQTSGGVQFKLFGMGFVSDAAGSTDETLFIAGGPVDATGSGDLASIDPSTMQVTHIGPLPGGAEYSPELTGTGDAELYGYYPGVSNTFIANIVKNAATHGQSWDMPPLGSQVSAWAFAHWGGQFYVFVTTGDPLFGTTESNVLLLDPDSGNTTTVVPDHDWVIVGAGVSTCAPIVIP